MDGARVQAPELRHRCMGARRVFDQSRVQTKSPAPPQGLARLTATLRLPKARAMASVDWCIYAAKSGTEGALFVAAELAALLAHPAHREPLARRSRCQATVDLGTLATAILKHFRAG